MGFFSWLKDAPPPTYPTSANQVINQIKLNLKNRNMKESDALMYMDKFCERLSKFLWSEYGQKAFESGFLLNKSLGKDTYKNLESLLYNLNPGKSGRASDHLKIIWKEFVDNDLKN